MTREREAHTSVDVVFSAAQSSRGSTLMRNGALISCSSCASSASFGCSGNEADVDLQALTAQVRKLMLSTFILALRNSRVGYLCVCVVRRWERTGSVFLEFCSAEKGKIGEPYLGFRCLSHGPQGTA